MKLQKFTPVLLVAVMFVVAGCSKTKKLTKRLEGTWNVDKMEGVYTPTGSVIGYSFSWTNLGTYTFKDDMTGSYSMVINGSASNGSFNWTNTETTVTTTESGNTPEIFTVTTNEKTKQVWTGSQSDADGTMNYTITLSKK